MSAVDGSNVSGVIEEVRTNGAVCSDRHLRHGNEAVRIGTKNKKIKKNELLFLATVFTLPNPAHVYRLPSCFANKVACL